VAGFIVAGCYLPVPLVQDDGGDTQCGKIVANGAAIKAFIGDKGLWYRPCSSINGP